MSEAALLLAIDQGTTNTKAVLVGREGTPVFVASAPVALSHPQPDWVEQDPLALWASVRAVIAGCLEFAAGRAIAAVGIANQRETVVAWHRATGEPLAPAVVWQCRRSIGLCAAVRERGFEKMLRERTGLGIDPLFSASKMQWLLLHHPQCRAAAERGELCLGTVDSWLIWKLTGGAVHACDAGNASRTQLLDLASGMWHEDLLRVFGVPADALPEVRDSSGFFGECAVAPLEGVPILSAMGDSHAALAGHGSFSPGTMKATYGTGSSVMTLLDELRVPGPCAGVAATVAWRVRGETRFALEGNITMAGAGLQWVGEFLGLPHPAADAARLAATVEDSAGVTFVPAMAGLGSPHWDAAVRGQISGLSLTSRAAHLARAAVEAIAFQVCDVVEVMRQQAQKELGVLHGDGGATRNAALMRFQADILGRTVRRSRTEELSALGAAWFAGLAAGWWQSLVELEDLRGATEDFSPGMAAAEAAALHLHWKSEVARMLKPTARRTA